MSLRRRADFKLTPSAAIALQERLRHEVSHVDQFKRIRTVAGVDAGFPGGGQKTRAAAALFEYPSLKFIAARTAQRKTTYPYVPGLLSFRELPAILDALAKLPVKPDLILCDGQGIAHPRRFGIACHLGWWLNCPTIGVGKSLLIGTHAAVGRQRGEWTPLRDDEETIGAALRTRTGVKPVYVSNGHRVSLDTAIELVLACTPRFRLPEPIRHADHLASQRGV
ncbi:MAG TPA: deoxyribonuclease V [Gammaproteobacteria bacterium]|nr:deoxyribonuclease V [Gammaproteobacteria bacterium]